MLCICFSLGHGRQAVSTSRSSERPHPVILIPEVPDEPNLPPRPKLEPQFWLAPHISMFFRALHFQAGCRPPAESLSRCRRVTYCETFLFSRPLTIRCHQPQGDRRLSLRPRWAIKTCRLTQGATQPRAGPTPLGPQEALLTETGRGCIPLWELSGRSSGIHNAARRSSIAGTLRLISVSTSQTQHGCTKGR